MFKKGSKINSIFTGSCPRCQKESMYQDKNPLHLTKVLKMNENCSHCGLKYQIEPSFFYGAMYVSYGLNVAVGIAAFIVSFVFLWSNDRAIIYGNSDYFNCIISFCFKTFKKFIHKYVYFLRSEDW